MKTSSEPFVSVLTPVYNGEKFISECIESVLSSKYNNFEYIIINNCSTDNTLEIANHYAQQDSRIRVSTNTDFLCLIGNHNEALRQMSPNSKYCKLVQADDTVFPECISEMVSLCETYPSIGAVASLRLLGDWVLCSGLPYPSCFINGKEMARWSLLSNKYVYGSPTTVIYRSDVIRERLPAPMNEESQHADEELFYSILQQNDFGFLHKVLSHCKRHKGQATSFSRSNNTEILGRLLVHVKYGHIYLSDEEYQARLKQVLNKYYKSLGISVLQLREKKYWAYHQSWMTKLELPISKSRVVFATIKVIITGLFNMKSTLRKIRN